MLPPKTGSTSLRHLLARSNCGHSLITSTIAHELPDPASTAPLHALLSNGRGVATLREPCSRFVSAVSHLQLLANSRGTRTPPHPYQTVLGSPDPVVLTTLMLANESLRRLVRGDGALLNSSRVAGLMVFWPQARWSGRGTGVSNWWCLPTLARDVAAFASIAGCRVGPGAAPHLRYHTAACAYASRQRLGGLANHSLHVCKQLEDWTRGFPSLCARVASLYPEDQQLWHERCVDREGRR